MAIKKLKDCSSLDNLLESFIYYGTLAKIFKQSFELKDYYGNPFLGHDSR